MEKNPVVGSAGVCTSMFTLNFNKRVAQKLRRIIPLHSGLVTVRFRFPKTRKVFIFMNFGPSGRVHGSQNQLFLTLDTSDYSNEFKKQSRTMFEKYDLGKSQSLENRTFQAF